MNLLAISGIIQRLVTKRNVDIREELDVISFKKKGGYPTTEMSGEKVITESEEQNSQNIKRIQIQNKRNPGTPKETMERSVKKKSSAKGTASYVMKRSICWREDSSALRKFSDKNRERREMYKFIARSKCVFIFHSADNLWISSLTR